MHWKQETGRGRSGSEEKSREDCPQGQNFGVDLSRARGLSLWKCAVSWVFAKVRYIKQLKDFSKLGVKRPTGDQDFTVY
jgi:hypothetical protein